MMRQWASLSFVCPICFELVTVKFNAIHGRSEVWCEQCNEVFTIQVSIDHEEGK